MAEDVTVLIPVRDRTEVLRRALAGVAAQTVTPAAVLVVDDASHDPAVAEVARAGGAEVLRLDVGRGAAGARNAGLAHASTTWVALLDSDDEWLPEHLQTLLAHRRGRSLVAAPGWRLPGGRVIGHAGARPLELTQARLLLPANPVCTSGVMLRRDHALAAGGFSARTHAEDLELWVEILEHGSGVVLPRPTVIYHEHAGQASAAGAAMREHTAAVLASFAGRPWWRSSMVADLAAVTRWDDLRAGIRAHDARASAVALRGLTPPRYGVLTRLLVHRWRSRHPPTRP